MSNCNNNRGTASDPVLDQCESSRQVKVAAAMEAAAARVNVRSGDAEESVIGNPAYSLHGICSEEREQEERKQDPMPSEGSCFSLRRFSTLPPILPDANPKHSISFMVPNGSYGCSDRFRLPPINRPEAEEIAGSVSKRAGNIARRKVAKKKASLDEKEKTEDRKRTRLRDYTKRRKQTLEAWDAARAIRIENNLHKLEIAEKNKEQIRQQKKRKLQYQEERRIRAKERVSEITCF